MNVSRSIAIVLIAFAGLAMAAPAAAEHHNQADDSAHTFVLVHGAWVGGWVWDDVKALLEAAGHEVYAPTLTGLAERSHLLSPDVNRSTHVADITNLIEFYQLDDVVLVGHSYGGLVISDVARGVPEGSIASIVYIDAVMPPMAPASAEPDLPPFMQVVDGTVAPLPLEMLGYDEAAVALFDRERTPMPIGAFAEPATDVPDWNAIPKKTYIRTTRFANPQVAEVFERVRSGPGWTVREIDTFHDMMLTEPEETARLLLEAAE